MVKEVEFYASVVVAIKENKQKRIITIKNTNNTQTENVLRTTNGYSQNASVPVSTINIHKLV